MDTEVSAFAVYKNNKSTNQEKKQKKRNKSRNKSSHVKSPIKLNVNEIPKEIAQKLKKRQKDNKQTKSIIKKKQHKKKKNKFVNTEKQDMRKKRESSNIAQHADDIPILVPVSMSKNKVNTQKQKIRKERESSNIALDDDEIPILLPVSMSKNKFANTQKQKIRKERESSNIALDDDEIPTLIPVPMSTKSLKESNSELKDKYHKLYDNSDTSSQCSSIEFVPVETDSADEGLKVFKWMIAPYNSKDFFNDVWEKKPLHIARNKPEYYNQIITTHVMDEMLRNQNIQFIKNVDITSYKNGIRETLTPEGRATTHLVWSYYLDGCSVRLLNPQTYIPKLHLLNATLQEYFNSFVGANVYLTPPDSQGFAPHYDDIEAFILQAEGKKKWRVYKPLNEKGVLPRYSSKNFDQNEIGKPILEVTLEAGDMLYFPRGYIHQAVTVDGEHSLHVTISTYQKHSWGDLLTEMLPTALDRAISEHVELREGLPLNIYDHFGLVHSNGPSSSTRKQISEVILSLFDKIKKHLPIDDAVDRMHKNYQHAALPPVLNDMEKAVTPFGDSDVMLENGIVINRVEIGLDTRIRLLRKNILRLVSEDTLNLYYYSDNSMEYQGNKISCLDITENMALGIQTLIKSYPKYVSVENLGLDADENIELADALWSKGLIMTEYPLENIDD